MTERTDITPILVDEERRAMTTDPDYPHVQAAFINAIREEGTKAEACDWLQKTWNELCAARAELRTVTAERDELKERLDDIRAATLEEAAMVVEDEDGKYSWAGEHRNMALLQQHSRELAAAIRALSASPDAAGEG